VVAALPPWLTIFSEGTHAPTASETRDDENCDRLLGGAARQRL
jgi:hypothetical protein